MICWCYPTIGRNTINLNAVHECMNGCVARADGGAIKRHANTFLLMPYFTIQTGKTESALLIRLAYARLANVSMEVLVIDKLKLSREILLIP